MQGRVGAWRHGGCEFVEELTYKRLIKGVAMDNDRALWAHKLFGQAGHSRPHLGILS